LKVAIEQGKSKRSRSFSVSRKRSKTASLLVSWISPAKIKLVDDGVHFVKIKHEVELAHVPKVRIEHLDHEVYALQHPKLVSDESTHTVNSNPAYLLKTNLTVVLSRLKLMKFVASSLRYANSR